MNMNHHTLDLACGCGATLHWSGHQAYQGSTEARWYEVHREHQAKAIGRCGDVIPVFGRADKGFTTCVLDAGHTGVHEDEDGATWHHPERVIQT